MTAQEIFALRKKRSYAEALKVARSAYPQNTNDIWFLRAYAWTLYDHVKNITDRYEAKQLSSAELSTQLAPYMREFARFGDQLRGDSAFSQMVRLAGLVSKDWQEFLGFARWAGIDDFAEDDKKSFINDIGRAVDSLQKRFIRAICREASAAGSQTNAQWVDWGKNILEHSLQLDPHDQWLNYYKSKLHLAQGEVDQAISRLSPVLHRQSKAAWPWALLGEILETTQPDDAITCYAYSTQLAREEQEVAKIRIHLARQLSQVERYREAAQQVQQASLYREQNKYKVPSDLAQMLASDWYREVLMTNGLQSLPDMSKAARSVLRELERHNLVYIHGVIDHINNEKALTYVATGHDTGFALLHKNFSGLSVVPPGTIVEIGSHERDGPPIDWRISEEKEISGLFETFQGTLQRANGKGFAFIRSREDVFVTPDIAKDFNFEQQYAVTCIAIKRTNKQGKTGWRAVNIKTVNSL